MRMKCLLVADLHYSLPQLDWVLLAARDVDLVIMAGDHLDISASVEGPVQIAVVRRYFRRLVAIAKTVVCSGNHDLDATNAAGEKYASWLQAVRDLGVVTDGDTFELHGTLFTVCPWWDGPSTRQAVDAQLARDAARRGAQRWVWIYHSPPTTSPTSLSNGRDCGDPDLAGWIATHSPDLVLSGHIHDAPFDDGGSWVDRVGSTWVFNGGRQSGAPPTWIVFDLDEHRAYWLAAGRAETVKLDGPLVRPIPELTEPPPWLTDLGQVPGTTPG